jgi:hypothetical protein
MIAFQPMWLRKKLAKQTLLQHPEFEEQKDKKQLKQRYTVVYQLHSGFSFRTCSIKYKTYKVAKGLFHY